MPKYTPPPASLIDEYGESERLTAEMKPALDKHKRLREKIEAYFETADPDVEYVCEGSRYTLQVSARGKQRTFVQGAMETLYKLLGKARFLTHASVKLADVDRLVADSSGILAEQRSGPRRFTAVGKAAPARLSKAA